MTLVWIVGVVVGITVASAASKRAVVAALAASEVARISPALMGVTVMAVGTDLPEIANSIVSALTGHGDVAVGDSAGSAMTQVTLVLAILCLAAGPIRCDRRTVVELGGLTVAALVLDAVFVRDQLITRWEGFTLVIAWFVVMVALRQLRPSTAGEFNVVDIDVESMVADSPVADHRGAVPFAMRAIAWLAVVAVSATVVVRCFVELTDSLGVPELVASAIVLSIGTSLPELVVDLTAIRQGAVALAIGDLFGSSLVDATLALGSGPALRATTVSPDAASICLIAAAGVVAATVVTARRSEHGGVSAAKLLGAYVLATAGLILWTSSG